MTANKKIPVVILNGFLGSGKTTLFRNLLYQSKNKNIKVAAVVNDMSALDGMTTEEDVRKREQLEKEGKLQM